MKTPYTPKRPAKRKAIKQPEITKRKTKTPMKIHNTVKTVLLSNGAEEFKPSSKLLEDLGVSLHRFNKLLDNKVEMTLSEIYFFSKWLQLPISDLCTPAKEEKSVEEKFNLKK